MSNLFRKVAAWAPGSLRSKVESFSRGRVVRRRLGAEFANRSIYVSPEASLAWLLPWATSELDRDLMSFCREFVRPGSVVWDFGGNIGLFSFAAAHRAGAQGQVVTIEPDPFLAQLIIRGETERPADCAPCTVVTAAVSREPGFATLEVPERSRAANALAGKSECSQRGGVRQRFDVVVVTIDQLAAKYPAPQVIKMDIEGSELDALVGGEATLKAARPIMLLEVQRHQAAAIRDLLRGWNYHLYDPAVPAAERRDLENLTYNTLAVPAAA
jgi:FkbM family methyltransferase